MALETRTVRGRFRLADASIPTDGSYVSFKPDTWYSDTVEDITYPPDTRKVFLDALGDFETELEINDSDNVNPKGWRYKVVVDLHYGLGSPEGAHDDFWIAVSDATPDPLELADLVPHGVPDMGSYSIIGPAGSQGIQGIQGPAGPASGEHKFFLFPTPSTSWPMPHNMGYRPNVAAITEDGLDITDGIKVQHTDENNCTVLSGLPIAGRAELA